MEHAALAALRLTGFESRTVPTSAGRVHVLSAEGYGLLPPIVLLHGFSSAGVHFYYLMRYLRPFVKRLIVPDAPAHGFSDAPDPIAPDSLQTGLLEALDQVVDEPSIVYGNSMGGLAALRFALERPQKVASLVVCSPVGAPMCQDEMDRFRLRFQVDDHARALAFVDRVFRMDGAMRHLVAWGLRRKFGHPAMRELLSAFDPQQLLDPQDLQRLIPPVLLVWGRAERVLPPEHRDFFLANLPKHARFEEPPRFGHGPYLEHPEAAAQQILAFARSVEAEQLPT
jgi:pimeloyl-ACP methyl ester carboxylesterase